MIKVVGAALILVACAGLGFQIARGYRDRPKQLSDLTNAIRMLRAEIEYSLTPLPQALERVAKRTTHPLDALFRGASERLHQGDSVPEAFQVGMDRCRPVSAFKQVDLEVVSDFALTLGASDLVHQTQQLDAALQRLAALENEARELQRKNERLWQYLGILLGLLLVIILY